VRLRRAALCKGLLPPDLGVIRPDILLMRCAMLPQGPPSDPGEAGASDVRPEEEVVSRTSGSDKRFPEAGIGWHGLAMGLGPRRSWEQVLGELRCLSLHNLLLGDKIVWQDLGS